jgi:bifunctional DNase/RNase
MRTLTRLGHLSLLLTLGVALVAARGSGAVTPPPAITGPQEVTVRGVFVDPHAGQPIVVLEGNRDKRSVAMAIGPAEATGIAVPLSNVTPPRPLTHDLFLSLFGRLNVKVDRVLITDLRDNTYFATLYLSANGSAIELDSRPSDAIALAVRAKAPVYVEDRVFDKAAAQRPGPALPPGSRI